MKRVRAQVELDLDEVSPTTIDRAQAYLTEDMESVADGAGLVVDWGTFATYTRRSKRKQTFKIVAWARFVK